MSVVIDNIDELLSLLKKLGVKVNSVDEVRQLLTTINANYNPEATRQKTGKLIALSVPGIMAGAAAFVSFFLVGEGSHTGSIGLIIGGLALLWGAVALVSVPAVIAGAILSGARRGRAAPETPSEAPPSRLQSALTGITNELP